MRMKLTLAYDGTGFRGWAAQPGLRTVGGGAAGGARHDLPGLERSRRRRPHGYAEFTRSPTSRASMPKAARGSSAWPRRSTRRLPDDVAVVSAEEAAPDFNARFDARSRTYRYRVWRSRVRSPFEARRSWWHPRPLDVAAAAGCRRRLLLGEHDFRAFTPTRDPAQGVRARRAGRALARGGRRARVRDHGRLLPAAHGADARRHDGRRRRPRAAARRRAARGGRSDGSAWGLYLVHVAYD